MELKLKEVEVAKLNLLPGEVLVVKLKGNDFDHYESMKSLHDTLKQAFPDNKVMVFAMQDGQEVELSKLSPPESAQIADLSDEDIADLAQLEAETRHFPTEGEE